MSVTATASNVLGKWKGHNEKYNNTHVYGHSYVTMCFVNLQLLNAWLFASLTCTQMQEQQAINGVGAVW